MYKKCIANQAAHLYNDFKSTYKASFPIFEQRTDSQQKRAFEDSHYNLCAYTNTENKFVGFVSYWEFDTYIYVEHFAIEKSFRGKKNGSRILEGFLHENLSKNKQVILEIDPPADTTAIARLHFYEHLGMKLNKFVHRHPAYRTEFQPHELCVMSAPTELTDSEYKLFFDDLANTVMR